VRILFLILTLALAFVSSPEGRAMTWQQAQQSSDYLSAKKSISEHLPDLAIPRVKQLISQPDLDQTAKASLLTLLGEAQVRAGLDLPEPERTLLLSEALKTLDDSSLREFSPSHLWRSYALSNLGRIGDAIRELERIDRRSMIPNANLQMASLMITIGDTGGATIKLKTLEKSTDSKVIKETRLHLITIALIEDRVDDASGILSEIKAENPIEAGLFAYLTGRIQLARGERLAAIGTFQGLIAGTSPETKLTSSLFHECTLALADSLALEGNEEAAVAALLDTLEKYPGSPRINGIFERLKSWSGKVQTTPLLEKLSSWIPPNFPDIASLGLPESDSDGSISATTTIEQLPLRSLYALEFSATTNLKSEDPVVRQKGSFQISHLQLAAKADSKLISRSLVELGLVRMSEKNYPQALAIFGLLDDSSGSTLMKAYAKALAGKAAFAIEKPEEASQSFWEAGELASKIRGADDRIHASNLRATAALNAGITLLATTRSKELDQVTKNLESPEARSFLILERGLFLSTKGDPAARDFLVSFLANFPASPRKNEAALALAESAILSTPKDPELARTHITALKFDLETQPTLEARRILVLLALNLGLEQANDLLTKAPDHPFASRILFQLGQTYRHPGVNLIGKANVSFERLLKDYPDSQFAEASRYFSALTAMSFTTESGEQTAISRFRELIENKGVLANEAAIALASLLTERDQQEAALAEIETRLKTPKLTNSDRRRLLIIGADASGQLEKYEQALVFYDQLLKIKNLPISTRNRASFQRGQILDTRLGQKTEALEAYLEVVYRDFDAEKTTNMEWKWFDKCGLEGALALLEREKRWRAAISLAEKLGQSGSPRAKDAKEIAERIGLEQFIYRGR
jgi:predicted negative regulator of RcsB-dependent stress response|tara:strand:+ start:774 stop:3392 length:2619 start_codon:yes stop_codon:yes gene_type:complete